MELVVYKKLKVWLNKWVLISLLVIVGIAVVCWMSTRVLRGEWHVRFLSWWQKGWRFSQRMCWASLWWTNRVTLFSGSITTLLALKWIWMVRIWLGLESTLTLKSFLCWGPITLLAFRFHSGMGAGFQSHLITAPSSSMLVILFRYICNATQKSML